MAEGKNTTALLIIDVQQGFDYSFWGSRNNPDAEINIARLLSLWRKAGMPVVHIRHDSAMQGSPLQAGSLGNDFKPEAKPIDGEGLYSKSVNSAFIGTDLHRDLQQAGIQSLVIVGLTTNHCVSTTARMAGNLKYNAYVVSDATATFDRPALDGTLRPATDVHNAALSDLHGEFATVLDTEGVISIFHQPPPASGAAP